MRVLTANSTGRTGVLISQQFEERGYSVHFMGSPLALTQSNCPASVEEYGSTRDLLNKMEYWIKKHPSSIVVHCAAVGDFEIQDSINQKIPSGTTISLTLHPTPKILDQIRSWDKNVTLGSFKAAPPKTTFTELKTICIKQLRRTNSDVVFGNILGQLESDVLIQAPYYNEIHPNRDDGLKRLTDILDEVSRNKKI